jgi:ABC-type nickel/cobalt efflux system permease component RcnA
MECSLARLSMAKNTPQSYANHTRLDPPFHFVLVPCILAAIVLSIILLVRHQRMASILWVLLALGLFLTAFKARAYALKVQDRMIRLEERLRLAMLLPEAARARIGELTESQLVALRFASDAELPALAMRALNEGMTSKQIKTSIQSWRPDYFRV